MINVKLRGTLKGLIGPSVGIQGKRQSQGRPLGAMEAKATAGFRFGKPHHKETTAVDDRQKIIMFISLKNGRARQVLKVFS